MKKSDCQKDINTDGNAMTFTVIYEGVKIACKQCRQNRFFRIGKRNLTSKKE